MMFGDFSSFVNNMILTMFVIVVGYVWMISWLWKKAPEQVKDAAKSQGTSLALRLMQNVFRGS